MVRCRKNSTKIAVLVGHCEVEKNLLFNEHTVGVGDEDIE